MLFFLLGILPMLVSAQNLAKKGRSVEAIVPQETNYITAEGDLNKDGLSDLVIYAELVSASSRRAVSASSRRAVLAVYFATPSGVYEQWKEYDNVLPVDDEDDDLMIDVVLSVTDRGTLSIALSSCASAGTSYMSDNTYIYRFQNGDFYKIGEAQHSMSRMTGEDETVSYNYLTNNCQRVIENAFDDSVMPKETWTSIPKKPLKKLGEELLNY